MIVVGGFSGKEKEFVIVLAVVLLAIIVLPVFFLFLEKRKSEKSEPKDQLEVKKPSQESD